MYAKYYRKHFAVFVLYGFCLLGDSMLYVVLPTRLDVLALTAGQVGILLSANRLIRLGSNFWASSCYERWGTEGPFYFAAILGSAITFSYGFSQTFWYLFLLRLLWGLTYSLLRLKVLLGIFSESNSRGQEGRLSGSYRSVTSFGYLGGMLLGGFLADRVGFSNTAYLLGTINILGVISFLAYYHRLTRKDPPQASNQETINEKAQETSFFWSEFFGKKSLMLILLAGLMVHFTSRGLLNSSFGLYLRSLFGSEIGFHTLGITLGVASVNGAILASRSVVELLFSPWLGGISDKYDKKKLLFYGLLALGGLVFGLAVGRVLLIAIVFPVLIFLVKALLRIVLYLNIEDLDYLTTSRRMASLTTVGDLGAALGPLALGLIDWGMSLIFLYLFCALSLLVTAGIQRSNFL